MIYLGRRMLVCHFVPLLHVRFGTRTRPILHTYQSTTYVMGSRAPALALPTGSAFRHTLTTLGKVVGK